MTRPQTSILVVGYPPVTAILFLLDGFFAYGTAIGNMPLWVGLLVFLFGGWLVSCAQEAARYRAWRRDWDSLDPNGPAPPRQLLKKALGALIGLGLVAFLFGAYFPALRDPESPARAITVFLVGALLLLRLIGWLRRRRPNTRSPAEWIVTPCGGRTPAPSAANAFASLPDYCRPLLTPSSTQEPR